MAMRDNPVFIDAAGRGQATLDALFCIDIIIDLLPGNWSTLNENPGRQEASEGGSKDEAVSTGAGGGEKLRQADVKLDKGLTVRKWLRRLGVGTLFIEPGSPWENGYVESFNGKLKDECLNGEVFLNLTETRYVVDRWRLDYNHHRPHSMLGWLTPAEFAAQCRELRRREPCAAAGSATPCPPQHTARGRLWLSLRVDQKMGAGQLADITGQIAMAFCFLIRRRLMR
jgi:hypothetical protein